MTNKEIVRVIKDTARLLELHDSNQFKVRSYNTAVFKLEKIATPLVDMDEKQLCEIDGISKSLAGKIIQIVSTGSFDELDQLINETPEGVIKMLSIPGLGPKKIRIIWQELEIVSIPHLLEACERDIISNQKGFGKKTQESILEALKFSQEQEGKYLFAEIEESAIGLENDLKKILHDTPVLLVGEIARKLDIIEEIALLVSSNDLEETHQLLERINKFTYHPQDSGPYCVRGKLENPLVSVSIHICQPKDFTKKSIQLTSSGAHLGHPLSNNTSIYEMLQKASSKNDEAFYQSIGLHYMPPETREGLIEDQFRIENEVPALITDSDLKGIIHNHSTFSDGKNTLEEMATYCKELGYEYLGISDHSVSAFYANGLDEDRIERQHFEIDELNKKMAPFRIFKGIESDILNDGALDYSNDILSSFDFIVSSIHSNLNMDVEKSTARLIKAIENPYTTILGHITGRLHLRRKGYPVDHKKVIDACADNGVAIEINANPWRLDIDWKWVPYALEKGVMLSINPDAHEKAGYLDMRYGVFSGRKGGLTKQSNLNSLTLKEFEHYLNKRKERHLNPA